MLLFTKTSPKKFFNGVLDEKWPKCAFFPLIIPRWSIMLEKISDNYE